MMVMGKSEMENEMKGKKRSNEDEEDEEKPRRKSWGDDLRNFYLSFRDAIELVK